MRPSLSFLLVVVIAGCDPLPPESLGVPDGSIPEPAPQDAGTLPGPRAVLSLWEDALDAPVDLGDALDTELDEAVEVVKGVLSASDARSPTLAGTLVLSETAAPTLTAEPTDALVVRFPDGRLATYVFSVAVGRWNGNRSILLGDHDLAFEVRRSSGLEATVHSTRQERNVTRSLQLEHGKDRSALSVHGTEQAGFDVGGTWSRVSDLEMEGSAEHGDWRHTFEEHRVSEMLTGATSALVTDVERRFSHALELDGKRYQMTDGRKVLRRREARSVTMLVWQGAVTRDGVRVGGFRSEDQLTSDGLWRTVVLEVEGEHGQVDRQLIVP